MIQPFYIFKRDFFPGEYTYDNLEFSIYVCKINLSNPTNTFPKEVSAASQSLLGIKTMH